MEQQTLVMDETGEGRPNTVVKRLDDYSRRMGHLPRQAHWMRSAFAGKFISLAWGLRSRWDRSCS